MPVAQDGWTSHVLRDRRHPRYVVSPSSLAAPHLRTSSSNHGTAAMKMDTWMSFRKHQRVCKLARLPGGVCEKTRAKRGGGFASVPHSPRWSCLICLLPNGEARPKRGGLRGPRMHVIQIGRPLHAEDILLEGMPFNTSRTSLRKCVSPLSKVERDGTANVIYKLAASSPRCEIGSGVMR